MPALQKLYNEYKDKIDFIFINSGEEKIDVDEYMKNYDLDLPVGYDYSQNFVDNFEVIGYPTTILLDKDKNLVDTILGSRSYEEFEEMLLTKHLLN